MATSFALDSSLLSKLDDRKRRNQPRWDADIIHPDDAGDFFSCDYLSLSRHPHLRQKFLGTLASEPRLLGSTGSRALTGSTTSHIGLEKYLAEELGVEKTMVYVSGYTANITFFGESAHVVVDEAHSIGLYGPGGKGLVRAWGLEKRVHTVMMTFTKTLNFTGGVITMNSTVYEYLSNHSVPWMFTSAPAHVDMIGMKFCFDVLKSPEADRLRETVMDLSHFFMSHFAQSTRDIPKSVLSLLNSETKNLNSRGLISPIFAIFSPDVVALQNHLNKKGYAARALAPPAVPRGKERLRIVIHAGNSQEQIKSLVEALREWALAQDSNVFKQDGALRSKL
ncbi:hypothetical protein H1R20_g9575, partial [Candolleomyces eurysporus]